MASPQISETRRSIPRPLEDQPTSKDKDLAPETMSIGGFCAYNQRSCGESGDYTAFDGSWSSDKARSFHETGDFLELPKELMRIRTCGDYSCVGKMVF